MLVNASPKMASNINSSRFPTPWLSQKFVKSNSVNCRDKVLPSQLLLPLLRAWKGQFWDDRISLFCACVKGKICSSACHVSEVSRQSQRWDQLRKSQYYGLLNIMGMNWFKRIILDSFSKAPLKRDIFLILLYNGLGRNNVNKNINAPSQRMSFLGVLVEL